MLSLVVKQLMHDRLFSLLSIGALSMAIAVLLVLLGFEQGQYRQLEKAVLNRGGDLIVVQAKVDGFMATRSSIPQFAREKVESISGVAQVHPLTTVPAIYRKGANQTPIYMIVFDSAGSVGPLLMGDVKDRGHFIVVDQSLARRYQLSVGDEFLVSDFSFEISAIKQESAFMTPFVFINYDGLIDLFLDSEIAPDLSTFPLLSYMIIDVERGVDVDRVRASIEQNLPEVDVFKPTDLAANDVRMGEGFYKPVLGLLTMVGFFLASLLAAILMLSAVSRSKRDFAILSALGFPLTLLLKYAFIFSLVLVACSILVGFGFAALLISFIEYVRPVYEFYIVNLAVGLRLFYIFWLLLLLGSCIPYWTLRNTDPQTAMSAQR